MFEAILSKVTVIREKIVPEAPPSVIFIVKLNLPESTLLSFNPIFIVSFPSELTSVILTYWVVVWSMFNPVSLITIEILPPSQGTPQVTPPLLTELPPMVILTIAFISRYATSYDESVSVCPVTLVSE